MSCSSSSSSQMNEQKLRALSRKELQALAKKENVKPANATSDKLIKWLLAKLCPAVKQEPSSSTAKLGAPSTSAQRQRTPMGLPGVRTHATAENTNPVPNGIPAAPSIPVAVRPAPIPPTPVAEASTSTPAPRVRPHSTDSAQPSGSAVIDAPPPQKPVAPKPPAVFTQAVHPSYPTQPFPCPSRKLLANYQHKLRKINRTLIDIPSCLPPMERILTQVERKAHTVTQALKTAAWDGYYVERELVGQMKSKQQLWDGTNVMPPGPGRDNWMDFLDQVKEEYDRLDQEVKELEEHNAEVLALKRQREENNGAVNDEDTPPSKRRKSQ
ncbi:hypothetical protein DFH06DRAFT_204128 [Mycena polygramma]|nr:hypothetical protein DFH06DRAFT_204128 [Mycena polygramma]